MKKNHVIQTAVVALIALLQNTAAFADPADDCNDYIQQTHKKIKEVNRQVQIEGFTLLISDQIDAFEVPAASENGFMFIVQMSHASSTEKFFSDMQRWDDLKRNNPQLNDDINLLTMSFKDMINTCEKADSMVWVRGVFPRRKKELKEETPAQSAPPQEHTPAPSSGGDGETSNPGSAAGDGSYDAQENSGAGGPRVDCDAGDDLFGCAGKRGRGEVRPEDITFQVME